MATVARAMTAVVPTALPGADLVDRMGVAPVIVVPTEEARAANGADLMVILAARN